MNFLKFSPLILGASQLQSQSTDETLVNLKFITHIPPNCKVNTKKLYIQENNFITTLSRTFLYVDNRKNLIIFLHNTINNSIDICKYNENLTKNVEEDLNKVIPALYNILHTYEEDVYIVSKIQIIIEKIEMYMDSKENKED